MIRLLILLLFGALAVGQEFSARIQMVDGPIIDQVGIGTKQVGHVRFYFERLQVSPPLYAANLENTGRACWDWPTPGGNWTAHHEFALGLPKEWAPIYHPLDGSYSREENATHRVWVLEGAQHPRALSTTPGRTPQPPIGHCVEGRQILRCIFGAPGAELKPRQAGLDAMAAYFHGGIGGGGQVHLQRVLDQWDWSGASFNPLARPRTAGTYFLIPADLLPGTQQTRGLRWFGGTPSQDGYHGGGSNGRYWQALGFLARKTPSSLQAGLILARHLAGHGWVHESQESGADNWANGWMTGRRRYEKSDDGFTGSAFWPDHGHLFTADLQVAAAIFDDPLLQRTAAEARKVLLTDRIPAQYVVGPHPTVWYVKAGSRNLARFLEGLWCAHCCTGEARYLDRAEALVNGMVANIPAGDRFMRNTEGGAGSDYVSPWMDGELIYRLGDIIDAGKATQHADRFVDHARWLAAHAVRPTGEVAYSVAIAPDGVPTATWTGWPVMSAMVLPGFWWAAQRDPSLKPITGAIARYWLRSFAASTEWYFYGSTEKTRGQEMHACARSGQMIADALGW